MSWQQRVLASLALVSAALWMTTAAASAQSLGQPSLAQAPTSPAKVVDTVSKAVQPAQPAAQAVTQAAAPVAKPVSSTAHQVTSTVAQTAKSAPTAVQPVVPTTVPTLPPAVGVPSLPAPIANVVSAAQPAEAFPSQVAESVVEIVADQAPAMAEVADEA